MRDTPSRASESKQTPTMDRRRRLTRDESKALTRRRLIEVGRMHILRDGLGNAVADRIAEDAGYSRGAFYGNFRDKEDLFLAIMVEDHEQQYSLFNAIIGNSGSTEKIIAEMREAFVQRVTNTEWLFLQTEFEAGSLRSEKMRSLYVDLHRRMLREGQELIRKLAKAPNVRLSLKPIELVLMMISLSQGLAVNQRLLGGDLPENGIRKLTGAVFDRFISIER